MQHDFNLAPGASVTIDVAGRFFKYKTGTGLLRIRETRGGYIDLMPGQGVENIAFTSLTIQDKSGAQNTGVILAGDFAFRDERISGVVEVISGEKTRVMAGNSFGSSVAVAPDPANYSVGQLWNPAGSGKNIFVNRIILSGSAAPGVEWIIYSATVALPNLVGTGKFQNKRVGGAVSTAERRSELRAGGLGVVLFELFPPQNAPTDVGLSEPIMVPPGCGVGAYPFAVNCTNIVNFQFYEDPI